MRPYTIETTNPGNPAPNKLDASKGVFPSQFDESLAEIGRTLL